MKAKRINWIAVFVLAFAMAFPLSLVLRAQGGRYPNMYAAMRALQNARQHLARAAHHYGGHRANALQAADNAIQQCRAAIRWANHH
jgi:hypothetical protein